MEFGPYRIVRRLAAGGMGEVFLAKLQRAGGFQKEVAVKSIHPKYMTNPRFIEFFEREARLAALLNHRHIVQIFDFGRDETRVWLAMEYVDGVDLKTVMNHLKGPLPLRICLDVIQAVAKALHYAHRAKDGRGKRLEIVHRDISPQNILLSFEGDVKVADFGLAHAAALGPDQDRSLKGKYAYMSPEQVSGTPVDARTDQFSLGTVFYEILSGQRAFHDQAGPTETLSKVQTGIPGAGFDALRSSVPDSVIKIVERALRANRMERFPDLGALVEAVRSTSAKLSDIAPPIDLSDWLNDLFPNRKISVGSTTVEATRTALAEEPIILRPESDKNIDMNASKMEAFSEATTGSHRADITSFPNPNPKPKPKPKLNPAHRITQSLPAVSRTISKVGRSSLMVVIMSAVLTSVLLSYIFIPRSMESPVSENPTVENEQRSVVEAVRTKDPVEQPMDKAQLGLDSNQVDAVDGPAPAQQADATVILPALSKDMGVTKPAKTTRSKSSRTVRKKEPPPPKKSRVSKSSRRSTVSEKSKTKHTKPPNPSADLKQPAEQVLVKTVVDSGIPVKAETAQSIETATVAQPQLPSLKILTDGILFKTKASKGADGGHQISSNGDLFQATISGIKISLRLSAPRGRFLLSAQARPWANITVDGRKLGGTPLAAFPLASGIHTLEFETTQDIKAVFKIELSR